MRVTFDPAADAAYLYLVPIGPGEAVKTVVVDAPNIKAMINIDLNKSGEIIGIEVIGATRALPSEFLTNAVILA